MLRTVAVLVLNGVTPFELGVACEVFGVDRRDTGGPAFDLRIVTPQTGPVKTRLGFEIVVTDGLETAQDVDLLVIPPYSGAIPPDAIELIQTTHRRGAWVLSMCTGAFALAEAGLLDGRRCTSHWMHHVRLASEVPTAEVDPNVLYVEDRGVITSAGTASGIDACLHLVRRELGAASAAVIARRMVVPPHRDGGQAQYLSEPVFTTEGVLSGLLDWAAGNLDADLGVAALARRAHMSERTFARRFKDEVGATPASWVVHLRLNRARELLERTTFPVESISQQVGFGGAAVLRHHFAERLGTSPQAYRRTFQGKPSDADIQAPVAG